MGLNVGDMKAVFPSDNLCSETGINDFKFKSVRRTILITYRKYYSTELT